MALILKSFLGGLSIAIASQIYLRVGGVAGALLFSIGLLLILNMEWKLFTGTVGFIKSKKDVKDNLIILVFNLIGSCGGPPNAAARPLVAAKLQLPFYLLLFNSIICGILIYCAVYCFRHNAPYMVVGCVAGFILFGAEHCIADFCYLVAARAITLRSLGFLLVVILGNSIGAIFIDRVKNL